jgi:hypothetical protein
MDMRYTATDHSQHAPMPFVRHCLEAVKLPLEWLFANGQRRPSRSSRSFPSGERRLIQLREDLSS